MKEAERLNLLNILGLLDTEWRIEYKTKEWFIKEYQDYMKPEDIKKLTIKQKKK